MRREIADFTVQPPLFMAWPFSPQSPQLRPGEHPASPLTSPPPGVGCLTDSLRMSYVSKYASRAAVAEPVLESDMPGLDADSDRESHGTFEYNQYDPPIEKPLQDQWERDTGDWGGI
jgi:hypothetical protein